MRDYLNIGPNPHDEPCLPNTHRLAQGEVMVFINQIVEAYPPPPGARVRCRFFDHDFGGYFEACVFYNDDDEEQVNYAFMVEADPEGKLQKWSDESKKVLAIMHQASEEMDAMKQ